MKDITIFFSNVAKLMDTWVAAEPRATWVFALVLIVFAGMIAYCNGVEIGEDRANAESDAAWKSICEAREKQAYKEGLLNSRDYGVKPMIRHAITTQPKNANISERLIKSSGPVTVRAQSGEVIGTVSEESGTFRPLGTKLDGRNLPPDQLTDGPGGFPGVSEKLPSDMARGTGGYVTPRDHVLWSLCAEKVGPADYEHPDAWRQRVDSDYVQAYWKTNGSRSASAWIDHRATADVMQDPDAPGDPWESAETAPESHETLVTGLRRVMAHRSPRRAITGLMRGRDR